MPDTILGSRVIALNKVPVLKKLNFHLEERDQNTNEVISVSKENEVRKGKSNLETGAF